MAASDADLAPLLTGLPPTARETVLYECRRLREALDRARKAGDTDFVQGVGVGLKVGAALGRLAGGTELWELTATILKEAQERTEVRCQRQP
ncbi:MAG: hypothetical protein KGJ23_08540 [Euryarchaeota archaeon]|nr:hypothetical protein [Euryarchaeota archaeon]MDE1836650.1 hypothetical protein [Euryarchaeota archaeon]MDE1880321.1 hypothetical protein [Euryarchaeota archaeon]MDE2044620.1 hypothetical protein [Thermoplasmata archaeon]